MSHSMPRRKWVFSICAVFPFAFATLVGCETGPGPRATVSGKVVFNNQPVTAGTVGFFGPNNRTAVTSIKRDGTYSLADVPVGDVTITVTTPDPPMVPPGGRTQKPPLPPTRHPDQAGPADAPAETGTPVRIPERYKDEKTSPLKLTVNRGSQDYDITLTP